MQKRGTEISFVPITKAILDLHLYKVRQRLHVLKERLYIAFRKPLKQLKQKKKATKKPCRIYKEKY